MIYNVNLKQKTLYFWVWLGKLLRRHRFIKIFTCVLHYITLWLFAIPHHITKLNKKSIRANISLQTNCSNSPCCIPLCTWTEICVPWTQVCQRNTHFYLFKITVIKTGLQCGKYDKSTSCIYFTNPRDKQL
jgi:hypothetical protein